MPCVNSLFGMNDQLTEYFWHVLWFRIDFYAIQILLAGWFITHRVKGEPHVCLFMLSYERCISQSWLNRKKCFCSHFYLSEINSCLFTSFILVWLLPSNGMLYRHRFLGIMIIIIMSVDSFSLRQHRKPLSFANFIQIVNSNANQTYRSKVSSSNWLRSQAIYSSDASVMRGHHDKSSARNFCRFSAISSMPSSVTLEHPDNDRTVKWGSEWTAKTNKKNSIKWDILN